MSVESNGIFELILLDVSFTFCFPLLGSFCVSHWSWAVVSQNASSGQGHSEPGSLPGAAGTSCGCPSPRCKVQVRANPGATLSGAKVLPLTGVREACLPVCRDHS